MSAFGELLGMGRRSHDEEALRRSLAGLDLQFEKIKRTLYAYGHMGKYFVCFKCAPLYEQGKLFSAPGSSSRSGIICRLKIPGTSGSPFNLSVSPMSRGSITKSLFGRPEPEPGFTVGPFGDRKFTESMTLFKRLSPDAKSQLVAIAQAFGGSCAVTPDWEVMLIGRKNALRLVGGDQSALELLGLQSMIPLDLEAQKRNEYFERMAEAVRSLSRDLSTTGA